MPQSAPNGLLFPMSHVIAKQFFSIMCLKTTDARNLSAWWRVTNQRVQRRLLKCKQNNSKRVYPGSCSKSLYTLKFNDNLQTWAPWGIKSLLIESKDPICHLIVWPGLSVHPILQRADSWIMTHSPRSNLMIPSPESMLIRWPVHSLSLPCMIFTCVQTNHSMNNLVNNFWCKYWTWQQKDVALQYIIFQNF